MTKKLTEINRSVGILLAGVFLAVSPIGVFANVANAATPSMYLAPSTTSVQNGNQVTIDVRVNAATFNGVQVDLNFPSTLQYIGYSLSGSATPNGFATPAASCQANFCLATYVNPPGMADGDVLIGRVTFKAIAGSGSSQVTIANSASVLSSVDNSYIAISKSNATINFTSPATPPPARNTATNSTTTTSQGTTTNSTNNTSSNNSSSGSTSTNAAKTNAVGSTTAVTSENPVPGVNPEQAKNDTSLAPQDVAVTIVIKDLSGKLVKNTIVKINGKEFKTDKNGKVKFEGKTYGVLNLTYTKDGKEVPLGKVTLVKGATDTKYEIIASENIASPSSTNLPILPGIVSVLLIAVGFFSVTRINKIRQDRKSLALHGLSGSMVSNKPIAPQAQPVQTISNDNVTTTNPSATIIQPTEYNPLSEEQIAEAAKKIVEDK